MNFALNCGRVVNGGIHLWQQFECIIIIIIIIIIYCI